MLPQWGRKTGKAGPNVILENLYNCKSTFICYLAKKSTIFREQNFKHFNLISFNLITTLQLLKTICKLRKCRGIEQPIMVILSVQRGLMLHNVDSHSNIKSFQTSNIKLFRNSSFRFKIFNNQMKQKTNIISIKKMKIKINVC